MTQKLVHTVASALILRTLPEVKPTTDSGARLIKGQAAIAHGETYDGQWVYLQAPAGQGWAAKSYLAPVDAPPPSIILPKWPRVPRGRDEIVALFGEPCKPLCEAGRAVLPAPLPLSWSPITKVTRFACHELMEDVFTSVFAAIHSRGYWSLLEDFGGCYNCREQRGTNAKTSTHSWGIGIDVNSVTNPLGAVPKMPKQLIAIFADHGFEWGGKWKRPDGMHFQYATGY